MIFQKKKKKKGLDHCLAMRKYREFHVDPWMGLLKWVKKLNGIYAKIREYIGYLNYHAKLSA